MRGGVGSRVREPTGRRVRGGFVRQPETPVPAPGSAWRRARPGLRVLRGGALAFYRRRRRGPGPRGGGAGPAARVASLPPALPYFARPRSPSGRLHRRSFVGPFPSAAPHPLPREGARSRRLHGRRGGAAVGRQARGVGWAPTGARRMET